MRILPSRFNPTGGIADFWNEIRRPQPYRGPILLVSIMPAALMIWWGVNSTQYGEPERPTIEYITTLDPARSEAEIMAENRANQEIKDLREAEEARIAEEKRRIYKEVGRASGMDVEAIERKAEAERAAEKAAADKRRAEAAAKAKESAGQ
jgi:nitrogen fixation-related uncharacterized protein